MTLVLHDGCAYPTRSPLATLRARLASALASKASATRQRILLLALATVAISLIAGCSTTPAPRSTGALNSDSLAGAPAGATPGAATCTTTAALSPPPRARRMAAAAQQEHALWGGAMIDSEGRLTQSGASEAEDKPRNGPGALAPWQRVLGYWRGVDPASSRLPYVVRYGAWRPADRGRLQAELGQAAAAGTQASPSTGAGEFAAGSAMLSPAAIDALRVVVDRVAVVDTPWSAAFISWLARQAGLADDEFTFSEAHADYARAGYSTRAREVAGVPGNLQALRACALGRTPPRVGDLVCHARARASSLHTFAALGAELQGSAAGSSGVPMHCDIVVAVDDTGFDAVGGNVLQSVTQRRLAFSPGTRLLDESYQPGACDSAPATCVDRHFNRNPWSLLLQWR